MGRAKVTEGGRSFLSLSAAASEEADQLETMGHRRNFVNVRNGPEWPGMAAVNQVVISRHGSNCILETILQRIRRN